LNCGLVGTGLLWSCIAKRSTKRDGETGKWGWSSGVGLVDRWFKALNSRVEDSGFGKLVFESYAGVNGTETIYEPSRFCVGEGRGCCACVSPCIYCIRKAIGEKKCDREPMYLLTVHIIYFLF